MKTKVNNNRSRSRAAVPSQGRGRRGKVQRQGRGHCPQFTGRASMSRDGFIFVTVEGQNDDIFVPVGKTRQALHGDTVKVAVTREATRKGARREGEIIEIIERSRKPLVGIYHTVGAQAWVLMQSKTMPYDIEVDAEKAAALGAKPGMKVAARIDEWFKKELNPRGHVIDVLGEPGANDTEMHAILTEFGLPYRFEPEVEKEAAGISPKIKRSDLKGRRDERETLTFTIDPSDAKDFDDALSFKALANGNLEVGVHIADVSWYVRPGSLIDAEAQARGTSVYLVDRTVPMLPEALCNNLCSLRPDEDKLAFSTIFEMTPKGEVVSSWIGRTIIRSDRRYAYEEVQEIIEKAGDNADTPLNTAILTLNDIALRLRRKRFKSGAINFERPEMKVLCDPEGRPVDVFQRITKEANWLVEEFMLLANRTVAEFIATDGAMNGSASRKARTFIYRVHDEPNQEKIESLRDFAGNFGHKMGKIDGRKAVAQSLKELLAETSGTPENEAIQLLALRAMSKAVYSTDNIGHYGLAFRYYTHFTSPIRRYPDTMVHRLLAMYLDGASSQDKEYYEGQCRHASEREQLAADAERASVKYKVVEYMQDKVGQTFDGTVSGVTEWGMYVEIDPTHIEGMVPLRTIRSDYFEFDEKKYRLYGRRTHKVYTLGERVRIRVKGTNLEQKLLDFELVDHE